MEIQEARGSVARKWWGQLLNFQVLSTGCIHGWNQFRCSLIGDKVTTWWVVCSAMQVLEVWVWERSLDGDSDLHSETRGSRSSLDCCFEGGKGFRGYTCLRVFQENRWSINQKLGRIVLYGQGGGSQWTSHSEIVIISGDLIAVFWFCIVTGIYTEDKDLSQLNMVSWLIWKKCFDIITIIKSIF